MNGIVKNINGLSIETTSQIPHLTKGQKDLLKLIRDCVTTQKSLDFGGVVKVYYDNVRKTFSIGEGWYYDRNADGSPKYGSGRYTEYVRYDIWQCWKEQKHLWHFKSQVRQWFVSNIGILVVKNQLVIIPTIDIGE